MYLVIPLLATNHRLHLHPWTIEEKVRFYFDKVHYPFTPTFPQHSFHLHSTANCLFPIKQLYVCGLHLHSFCEGNSARGTSKSKRDDNMDRGDIVVQYSYDTIMDNRTMTKTTTINQFMSQPPSARLASSVRRNERENSVCRSVLSYTTSKKDNRCLSLNCSRIQDFRQLIFIVVVIQHHPAPLHSDFVGYLSLLLILHGVLCNHRKGTV